MKGMWNRHPPRKKALKYDIMETIRLRTPRQTMSNRDLAQPLLKPEKGPTFYQ
jgi:hypothetical protein